MKAEAEVVRLAYAIGAAKTATEATTLQGLHNSATAKLNALQVLFDADFQTAEIGKIAPERSIPSHISRSARSMRFEC